MPHTYVTAVFRVLQHQTTHATHSSRGATSSVELPGRDRENHRIRALAIGGTDNHVHLLLAFPPDLALSDGVRILKANSSRLMRESSRAFAWQEGYGAFSVSPSQIDGVKRYIANQAIHHAKRSYDDEFAAMLRAANRVPPLKGLGNLETHAYPPLPRWAN